jgi:hypothetical protein
LFAPQLRANGKVWILKSLAYDSVHRADLFKLPCPPAHLEAYLAQPDITITEQQPWLLQEFIKVSVVWQVIFLFWAQVRAATPARKSRSATPALGLIS